MTKREIFDNKADSWALKKEFPWARMRYEITNEFINNHLSENPKRILNIGCGDGIESFLFDSLNAEHVLTDYSDNMLFQAENFLEEESFNSRRVFIQSDVNNIVNKIEGKFDLILFHNVLEYIDDPERSIKSIYSLLSNNGILSIRHLNRYTNFCAPALYQNDLDQVEEYLHSNLCNSSFDMKINTYTSEEIENFFEKLDFKNYYRYGIMSLNNYIYDNKIKEDRNFYNKQKGLEIEMATMFPYFHMARFGLFICVK